MNKKIFEDSRVRKWIPIEEKNKEFYLFVVDIDRQQALHIIRLNVISQGAKREAAHSDAWKTFDGFNVLTVEPFADHFESVQMESIAHEEIQKKQLTNRIENVEQFHQDVAGREIVA